MARPRGTSDTIQVAAADKIIAPANPQRRGIIISNGDDASNLWVNLNKAAAIGSGIRIPANAPSLILTAKDWGNIPEGEIHAIAELLGGVPPAFINVTVWALEDCGAPT